MYVYDALCLNHFPKTEDPEGAHKHKIAELLRERYGNYRDAVSMEKAEFFHECAEEDRQEYEDGIEEGQTHEDMVPCLWEAEVRERLAENIEECLKDEYENKVAYRKLAGW